MPVAKTWPEATNNSLPRRQEDCRILGRLNLWCSGCGSGTGSQTAASPLPGTAGSFLALGAAECHPAGPGGMVLQPLHGSKQLPIPVYRDMPFDFKLDYAHPMHGACPQFLIVVRDAVYILHTCPAALAHEHLEEVNRAKLCNLKKLKLDRTSQAALYKAMIVT